MITSLFLCSQPFWQNPVKSLLNQNLWPDICCTETKKWVLMSAVSAKNWDYKVHLHSRKLYQQLSHKKSTIIILFLHHISLNVSNQRSACQHYTLAKTITAATITNLQQIKVSFKCHRIGIIQALQLLSKKCKNLLNRAKWKQINIMYSKLQHLAKMCLSKQV